MTASYGDRHQRAVDDAWRAWRRLGLVPYRDLSQMGKPVNPLVSTTRQLTGPIGELCLTLIEEMDLDFDREVIIRVCTEAAVNVVHHLPWALNDAIADELARPEPSPFDPPPAGSWIRNRSLPRPAGRRLRARPFPEWQGAWHRFSGDLIAGDARTQDVFGRARCGKRIVLRWTSLFDGTPVADSVLADDRPGVDVCRTCDR